MNLDRVPRRREGTIRVGRDIHGKWYDCVVQTVIFHDQFSTAIKQSQALSS